MTGRTCAGTLVTGTGEDGAAARGLPPPRRRQRGDDGARRRPGGRLADRDQPGHRARAARAGTLDRAPACSARRRSTPSRSSTCSPRTAARTGSRSAIRRSRCSRRRSGRAARTALACRVPGPDLRIEERDRRFASIRARGCARCVARAGSAGRGRDDACRRRAARRDLGGAARRCRDGATRDRAARRRRRVAADPPWRVRRRPGRVALRAPRRRAARRRPDRRPEPPHGRRAVGAPPASGPVHVTVTTPGPRSREHLTVHTTTALPQSAVLRRHHLPLTAPERTLIDIGPADLARALEEAQVRRLTTARSLDAAVRGGPRRRGTASLAAALDGDAPSLTPSWRGSPRRARSRSRRSKRA